MKLMNSMRSLILTMMMNVFSEPFTSTQHYLLSLDARLSEENDETTVRPAERNS